LKYLLGKATLERTIAQMATTQKVLGFGDLVQKTGELWSTT